MTDAPKIKTIDVNTAKNMLNESLIIVDIRSKVDYDSAKIEGAVHVDPITLDDFLASTPKNSTILCYCYFGNSSINFCVLLEEQGYTDVQSLEGGFDAWNKAAD